MIKIWVLTKSLATIYLLILVTVYLFQRQMIYMPTPFIEHNFKTVQIKHNNQTTEALVARPAQQQAIIYFGGNAENVIYTAGDFLQELPQHTTYLLKYRGYSGAEGTASEAALYADALALFDQVKEQHKQVKVIGRSLGTGVATYLASQRTVDKLILVTPFTSLRAVAIDWFPIFPIKTLLKDHYDSAARVNEIKAETLIVAAENDEVINAYQAKTLFLHFPENQATWRSINSGHNDLDLSPEYFSALKTFLHAED